jgi:UDP-N-acetyl-D-mannosaminouronate:lipid I N-acetyl-D-mannosaminouronosyltransferase
MVSPVLINGFRAYSFSSKGELIDFAASEKKILIALNAEKVLKEDNRLKSIVNNNIGYADGIGVMLALRKKGIKNSVKMPGVELWLDIIRKFKDQKTFYVIGSTKDIIEAAVQRLKEHFPGIQILNYRDGFIKDESEKEMLKGDLLRKKPDVVFVAMGTPKQEYLMEELFDVHPAIYQGLGGSLDIYSGKLKRAPRIFIRLGLEWLFRLMKQPTRIGRQYVYLRFLVSLMLGKI